MPSNCTLLQRYACKKGRSKVSPSCPPATILRITEWIQSNEFVSRIGVTGIRISWSAYRTTNARRFVIYALFGVNRCAAGQATAQDYVAFLIMIMQLAPRLCNEQRVESKARFGGRFGWELNCPATFPQSLPPPLSISSIIIVLHVPSFLDFRSIFTAHLSSNFVESRIGISRGGGSGSDEIPG